MKPITIEEFRNDIFNLVDRVAETGEPLLIKYKGWLLKVVLVEDNGG